MTYKRYKYGLGIGGENLACADLQLSIRKHHWICNKHTKGMFACRRKDENRQSPMSCKRSVIQDTWGSISSQYDYIWSCGISWCSSNQEKKSLRKYLVNKLVFIMTFTFTSLMKQNHMALARCRSGDFHNLSSCLPINHLWSFWGTLQHTFQVNALCTLNFSNWKTCKCFSRSTLLSTCWV